MCNFCAESLQHIERNLTQLDRMRERTRMAKFLNIFSFVINMGVVGYCLSKNFAVRYTLV